MCIHATTCFIMQVSHVISWGIDCVLFIFVTPPHLSSDNSYSSGQCCTYMYNAYNKIVRERTLALLMFCFESRALEVNWCTYADNRSYNFEHSMTFSYNIGNSMKDG